jgi:hypothetical protein
MIRWSLRHPGTGVTYTMPINPNTMTNPHGPRQTIGYVASPIDGAVRARRGRRMPQEWAFGGVIRTQDHHDALRDWCSSPDLVELTDHLARRWLVRLVAFEPEERRPTPYVTWRFRYMIRCYVYRRLA